MICLALGMAGAGASSKDALRFRFKRLPDGNAVFPGAIGPGHGDGEADVQGPEREDGCSQGG